MPIVPGQEARAQDVNDALDARLVSASNLADVPNPSLARTNLGIPDAILTTLAASGLYTFPTPSRLSTGNVTATGFDANFDIVATTLSTVATAGFVVSANSDMSNPVYTAVPIAPAATAGRVASYRTAKFSVTGLTPDTQYYYRPWVNGAAFSNFQGTVRTAPTPGIPTSFNFIWASCTNRNYVLPNVYATIAPKAPAFIVHGGDVNYLDPQIADIGLMRDGLTRAWKSASGVQSMLLAAPIVMLRDDHETWANNGAWYLRSGSGYTFEQIVPLSLQELQETTPTYPVWDSRIIGQSWDWGRCRFVAPDLRHQGVALGQITAGTLFGTGTSPVGSYDQLTKVLAEIDRAETDGRKALFFISTRGWTPAVGDSWESFNPAEQAIIADKLRLCAVQVFLLVGDRHQMVIDDGTTTDRTSGHNGQFPMFLSSGWFMLNLQNLVTEGTWDGADGLITFTGRENATAFMNIKVIDNGGSDFVVEAEYWGGPINGTTATLLSGRTYRTDDATPVMEFPSASTLYIPDGEDGTIPLNKIWFGAASATGAFSSGRAAPTVAFGPNNSQIEIPYPYVAGASDLLSLSAPVGCTLGTNYTQAINYYTLDAATVAYLAAMTVQPTTAQVFAINTLITGLISDGVWVDLVKFWWLGAQNQQASLINMVAPADAAPVPINSPSFSALRGWRGNGNTGADGDVAFLDTGYLVPVGMQNDISMFVYTLDAQLGQGDMGVGTLYVSSSWTTGPEIRFRACAATTDSVPSPTGEPLSGLIGFARNASTGYIPYVDGQPLTTVTRTSAAPTQEPLWLVGYNNTTTPKSEQSSPRTNTFNILANGLSGAQVLALRNRIATFLVAVGTT